MYKGIMNRKIADFCKNNSITNEDDGFLQLVNEIFYNECNEELDDAIIKESIVDGNCDKQVDLIQIENEDTITIRIIQVKKKNGFESNTVILLRNGLDWIFNKTDEEIEALPNETFKNKILEVRDEIYNNNLSNIYVDVIYATLGKVEEIRETDEIMPEINALENQYKSMIPNFTFKLYGAKELYEYIENKNNKSVDVNFNIVYDVNVSSIITNNSGDVKSLTCNITAAELIKVFEQQNSEYLFEQNVRKYLGKSAKVNQNIVETASGNNSKYFLALNNGVTIICDKFDLKIVGGSASVDLKNLSIINGCQTSMALYKAYKEGCLKEDTLVLLRVHETNDKEIIDNIILSTNNQNPINSRDLLSNTKDQIELQKYFWEIYGLTYQRKRNDFMNMEGESLPKSKIISNDKVGQAALACIKCMPYMALSSKGKVFTDYCDIFLKDKGCIALSYFIYEKVLNFTKNDLIKDDRERLSFLKFARFHITYLVYLKHMRNASEALNKSILDESISLDMDIMNAISIVSKSISDEHKQNLLKYFKTKESFTNIANEKITDIALEEVACEISN